MSETTQLHITKSNSPSYLPLVFAIVMGFLGAFINTFSFPFLPEVQMIFGNIAFVIVAMRLKPKYAVLTALITVTPLYFIWGHPFGYITFGLEAFLIAYFRSKGHYVLFSDIIYWIVIGMPLTSIIIWFSAEQADIYWLFISLKQGFNAALYTSIACLIVFTLDKKLAFTWQQQPPAKRSLRLQLVYAIILITNFALITATMSITRNLILTSQALISTSLEDSARRFSQAAQIYFNNQKHAINIAARWLSTLPREEYQQALASVHQSYSGFRSMLITDETGKITNISPVSFLAKALEDNRSVSDRDYFLQAMLTQSLYVSPVFQGRGIGSDPIVAISTPIYKNNQTDPVGIVEGSLDLSVISDVSTSPFGSDEIYFVIIDQHDNVIFASNDLALEPLIYFDYQEVVDSAQQKRLKISSFADTQFAYSSYPIANGWRVFTLLDYQMMVGKLEREYLIIFISLIITLLAATFIANRFGKRITRPLTFISKQIHKFNDQTIEQFQPLYFESAAEVSHLYDELKKDKQKVAEYQQKLEDKVVERTQALNHANDQLKALALKDGLTEIYNRRYLDDNFEYIQKSAQRNMALMTVIMLDLDHFKNLNDQYGHLTGDKVLIQTAQLIQAEFSRETDTVVRFGGEEFLIVAPYINVLALQVKLEALRNSIANFEFTKEETNKNSPQSKLKISASFGALIADADYSTNILDWIKVADKCLYQAKDSGRNRVIIKDKISRESE